MIKDDPAARLAISGLSDSIDPAAPLVLDWTTRARALVDFVTVNLPHDLPPITNWISASEEVSAGDRLEDRGME